MIKEVLGMIFIGGMIALFLVPYFSLWDLNQLSGIKDELREIKKELEKLNDGIRRKN